MKHEKTEPARRTSAIHLRAFPAQRDLIDRACNATQKKLTDFILEAACREAEQILCDRHFFTLAPEDFDAFEKALSTPLNKNQAVKKLLSGSAPWDG